MKNGYRIGLDVGTNSLGWCVLELDNQNNPCRIEDAGVRIFSDGRDEQSKATLAATRRERRAARRRRDRFKQRQTYLLNVLTSVGLFPEKVQERKALQTLNPMELRARAIKEKLAPHEVGRALFHLNQRRGFKSNRMDRSEETTGGMISGSARMLLEDMGLIAPPLSKEEYMELTKEGRKAARQQEAEGRRNAWHALNDKEDLTYGAFLWQRQQAGRPTRARPGAGVDGKLYDVYPTRELYEDEFNKIWAAQERHHPALMTPENRADIHHAIFTQRPLKPQVRGRCIYMSSEHRTYRAMPSFQRYRIYQEVNSLEWTDDVRLHRHPASRDSIVALLERPPVKDNPTHRNGHVSFHKMKTVLKNNGLVEGMIQFNFETPARKGFDCNLTSHVMQHEDYVGRDWHEWPVEKQDNFIEIILDNALSDEDVQQRLMGEYHLSETSAERCMNAPLVDGTANISIKAARLMREKMAGGIVDYETGELIFPLQYEAAQAVAESMPGQFMNPLRQRKSDGASYVPDERLPYYGKAFEDERHIIPGNRESKHKDNDFLYYGGVGNPTVHIALNQIRQVVNELIDRYGHPSSIAIELGRNLPEGPDGRRKIEKEQSDNRTVNEKLDKVLLEHGQASNRDNRLRLRLWEELDDDPNGRCCPFSGEKIGFTDLFTSNTEIEYLLPFSRSLDDSRANKVLCTRRASRDKGNRTPFEAFGSSPDGYDWGDILERVKRLPDPKRWRFGERALKIWNKKHQDFSERHLNDTRYIGRLTREYLECICHIDKIDVVTGRLTGFLRGHWGLNSVLNQHGVAKKNRDDHRHHAVDAIVVGMTSRAMLQKVSAAANRAHDLGLDRLFVKNINGKSPIDPWDGFRNDVKGIIANVIVSHKARRKRQGQLHKHTAYGIVSGPDPSGYCEVVERKPVDKFKTRKDLEAIRDNQLQDEFVRVFDEAAGDSKAVIKLAKEKKIRRLRTRLKLKVIPISDRHGKIYKAYKGDSNWAMEIYSYPLGHEKADRWQGEVISRFDANKPDFKPGETFKPHPGAKLVMRLQIDDCIEIDEGNQTRIMRVQKMNQQGQLSLAPLHEANVDARSRDKNDSFNYLLKQAVTLKPLSARKVHISPTGRVSYEKRQ